MKKILLWTSGDLQSDFYLKEELDLVLCLFFKAFSSHILKVWIEMHGVLFVCLFIVVVLFVCFLHFDSLWPNKVLVH